MCPKVTEAQLKAAQQAEAEGEKSELGRTDLINHEWCTSKAQINGTVAHITAIFGFTLAGLVIQSIQDESTQAPSAQQSSQPNPQKEE